MNRLRIIAVLSIAGLIGFLAILLLPPESTGADSLNNRLPPPPFSVTSLRSAANATGEVCAQSQAAVIPRTTGLGFDTEHGQELQSQIDVIRTELTILEAKVYGADPALSVYENYRNVPDEWRSKLHLQDHWDKFANDPSLDAEAKKKRQAALDELRERLKPVVMHDLSSNGFEQLHLGVLKSFPPEGRAQIYATQECWAGLKDKEGSGATDGTREVSAEELLEQNKDLYPIFLELAARLCRDHAIPPMVYEAVRVDSIYRGLTGNIDIYIVSHTPQELSDLRQKLRALELKQENLEGLRQLQTGSTN